MEKLKKVLEQYGRWSELKTYLDRIEAHIHTDFSHSLENAKALLETISKEICCSKEIEIEAATSINNVLKKAFTAIGYTSSSLVTQVSSALATIGQQIGELRNEIGVTSHGKSLEELKERNNKVDELTKEFLIDTTEIVACFLIRTFENENPRLKSETVESKLLYIENEDFNEFWDNAYGEFGMGDYSYTASEILYHVDYPAYLTEHKAFTEWEEGENGDE
ncbi:abortive infection family protein [Geosporobacter ferrireducens]|uniref:abortive infection family protein n=1 Tax=Geosporobacter ferrireducens TaxID=1424294 RepID=UPI00139B3FE1|nr:abortive infection family protein [Geosporobacter ferrireducens]MTI56421.1 hypothetical protein [Geosporobacter ferrireducens]